MQSTSKGNDMKALLFAVAAMLALTCGAKDLKVLMVGNSFSQSVLAYLPKLAAAAPDCKLKLGQAMIGGCTMERHCNEFKKAEQDPKYKPYWTNLTLDPKNPKNHKASLKDLLTADKWDIVTIQQGSHQSWMPEKFGPYAEELIGIIRKYAPQAEIVVHQTWAYRSDDPRIAPGKPGWKFEQKGMYERLTKNYTDLAKKHNFRIIPVGYAVQLTREKSPVKFRNYDPALLKTLNFPDLPSQAGDVVGNMYWGKDRKSGEMQIRRDSIHLNNRGNYLQGCTWFMFLFNKKAADVKFIPNNIGDKDAKFLAECAEEAVAKFPQVKK